LHIRPFLGHVKLAELTPGAVQSFRNVLVRNGRSRVMADRIVWGLGSILADAMANGRVARNVVREQARQHRRRARIEKRHKRQLQVGVDIPTKDEIRAMLEHAGRLRPLLVTATFTGLRASELRGLTWDAVDLERKVLTVRQRADRWNTIGSPKSASAKREVPLAPIVVNTLKEWKLRCPRFAGDGEPRLLGAAEPIILPIIPTVLPGSRTARRRSVGRVCPLLQLEDDQGPWHCLPEHRPLGNQSRARLRMYTELSRLRQQVNKTPHIEPTGDEVFE
jgi:integrase